MEKNKILEEIERWNKISKENDNNAPEILRISDAIDKIEQKMLDYFIKKYGLETIRKHFKSREILDANGILIPKKMLKITIYTHNFGYGGNDKYYINPESALMLYNVYLEFTEGKINGNIRKKIDYENLTYSDLYQLNQYEMIYWCFIHNITFEDFAKMNFIHECSHRFGISSADDLDPYIFTVTEEGLTELIARDFAKEENLPYIPLFRQKELDFIYYFFDEVTEDLKYITIAYYDDEYDVLCRSMYYLFNLEKYDMLEIWYMLNHAFGSLSDAQREWKKSGTNITPGDSFFDVFDKISMREDFIQKVEEVMKEGLLKKENINSR